MMNKLLQKNNKGYTLTELLVGIAILLIVCAIGIPAVGSLRKNLDLTKYDDVSRQIFLVSQNKLTTMKACGTLDAFLDDVKVGYSDRQLGALKRQPQDFVGNTEDWRDLYYFTDEDTLIISNIIGLDSILLASMEKGGHFLLEINPKTGDVYGVFYSEKQFTYDEIEELDSRTKSERKEKMIGYYGGFSKFSVVASLPQEFNPSVAVVNKEDLYLVIECADMRKLIKNQDKIILTLTVTDETFIPENASNQVFTMNLKGGKDFWISNDKVEIQILLDSIRGGNESFANITQGSLTLGDNISATVSMSYANEGVTITGSAVAPATNSLFASKDESGNLAVSCVRHLNNLRSEAYSFTGREGLTISQTAAIDYDYNNWDANAMMSEHAGEAPYLGTFAPIKNEALFNHITFNGNNNMLLNFNISGTDNVGLFSSIQNCTLTDMKLVNFNVSGRKFVGALAGQITNGTIKDCGVYLETMDEYGHPLSDMRQRVQDYAVAGTGSYVGGLVGQIDNCATSDSFAAVNVSGSSFVGGFCGRYNNGNGAVSNCYASGKVNASLYFAGGFAGETVNTSLDDSAGGFAGETANTSLDQCYSTSTVTAPSSAGGFVGIAKNVSITNCNSYGIVQGSDGTMDNATSGGFAGKFQGDSTAFFGNCKYLQQESYNAYTTNPSGVSGQGFLALKASGAPTRTSYPYYNKLVGKRFPFGEQWEIPHYGDWYFESIKNASGYLTYYEKYTDGSYGYRFMKYVNGNGTLTSLGNYDTNNSRIIENAGYGILRFAGDTGSFKLNGTTLDLDAKTVLKSSVTVDKGTYDLYSLSGRNLELLIPASRKKYEKINFQYDEIEDGFRTVVVQTLHVNGNYADAISLTPLQAVESEPLKVRTREQLQNMTTTAAVNWYIKLEHNIIASADTGKITNSGYVFDGGYLLGGSEKTFDVYKTGSNGNYIFGLTKALFRSITPKGTIKNLALIDVNMNGATQVTAAVAEENNGNLQNCIATGKITTTSGGSAGLVVQNNGSISTSYSNIDISSVSGNVAAVALNNRGTISNCYALGNITSTNANASGFIGSSANGSVVQNCYTLAKVTGGSHSYGFAPSGSMGITPSTCFWAKDRNINSAITNSVGTQKTLIEMKKIFTIELWTKDNENHTWPDSMDGSYPYPRISDLDHYGDWPVGAGGKVGAAMLYYKGNGSDSGDYAKGLVIDFENNTAEIELKQAQGKSTGEYGIIFDSTFAENLTSWKATYYYNDNSQPENIDHLSISPEYKLMGDASAFSVCAFQLSGGKELDKIVIWKEGSNTEYVFTREKGNGKPFSYLKK